MLSALHHTFGTGVAVMTPDGDILGEVSYPTIDAMFDLPFASLYQNLGIKRLPID